MKYKAIIFDMDGTITDTNHIWHNATKDLIRDRGIELNEQSMADLINTITGLALSDSCKVIKTIIGTHDPIEQIMKEKLTRVRELYKTQVRFMSGFQAFHNTVRTHNLKTSIATNASQDMLEITDARLNLKQFFGEHMYHINHVHNVGKPAPAIYLHAAHKIEVDPKECIAIEDSAHGITAAKAAGMLCIGLNSSGKREQTQHAHVQVDSYEAIDLHGILNTPGT